MPLETNHTHTHTQVWDGFDPKTFAAHCSNNRTIGTPCVSKTRKSCRFHVYAIHIILNNQTKRNSRSDLHITNKALINQKCYGLLLTRVFHIIMSLVHQFSKYIHPVDFFRAPPWSSASVLDHRYLKVVSSLTSLHYLWRSLGPFSLPCVRVAVKHQSSSYTSIQQTSVLPFYFHPT